ncbi:MAG: 30S ribosomal protein S1 [Bacteroidales bacterium]|jgi:small subunit ribosomal protein S1|nr:30S ribosomal protein S1 [Bacteroidales bacterium]HHV40235.1 30S ribosomal protein S1 [Bacteroidales bacterium]
MAKEKELSSKKVLTDLQDPDDIDIVIREKEKTQDYSEEATEVSEAKKTKRSNASIPGDKFNWDSLEEEDVYDSERSAIEELYAQTLSKVVENEIVDGTVVALNKREVIVNIGFKSEGVISINEFRYNPELAVGDVIDVYVETAEDRKGQLIISHKKARSLRSWDRVNEAYDKDEIVKGYIKCRTKGGMIVDIFGIEAFLPGSQIDVKPIRDYDIYVDKTMEFKIVKINHEYRNVVVSHKALIEAELEAQKAEIISKLEKGQILEGTVKNITSYGVFVDLGGVDGLIHITDLSWGRINHPEEIVELDQKINVVILDFDDTKKRIALGLKQLTPHPWDAVGDDIAVGTVVKGRVVVIADYGAFVEVQPGVEGLIHVTEISWSSHLRSAQDFLKVGQEVDAVVLTIDKEERKMSLGIKQLKPDPWATINEKYPVDSRHKAVVRNFTNFGIFVELEEGVEGLVHISDLSWSKKVKHPSEFTSIGEELEIIVLEVDQENRRLRLGHKQLEENPWEVFETVFTIGSVHEGTVTQLTDKGATVTLPYGIDCFVGMRNLTKEDGSQVALEEKLPFKVLEFHKNNRRITISHTHTWEQDLKKEVGQRERKESDAETTQKAVKKLKANLEKTTLGDISELAALKSEMEQNAAKSD